METHRQAPQRLGRRPALDGIRALAVMLVIGIHVGMLAAGYIGVDVFLPLSGFLITALLYEEWERHGTVSLRRFYERRARRLLPALLLLVGGFSLVIVLLHPFELNWPLGRLVVTTLLFVNNWVSTLAPAHGSLLGALSPTWTLAQEGQFYLLWPPLLWFLLRRGVRPRTVIALLIAGIALQLAIGLAVDHFDPNYNPYTSPFDRSAELLFGAVAAIAWRERLVPAAVRSPLAGWLAVAGMAYLVARGVPAAPKWYLAAGALSALLVVHLLSRDAPPRGVLDRALAWRPLAYVGRISYGIYLFHVPIYYLLWTYAPVGQVWLYWVIVLALSTAAAAASWELIESPVRRAGRRSARPGRARGRARRPQPAAFVPARLSARQAESGP